MQELQQDIGSATQLTQRVGQNLLCPKSCQVQARLDEVESLIPAVMEVNNEKIEGPQQGHSETQVRFRPLKGESKLDRTR